MDFFETLLCFNLHFTVTSAKRSIAENKAVRGVPNSQHLFGESVDIKPYGSTSYNRLLEHIHNYSDSIYVFDQLILYPSFIHIHLANIIVVNLFINVNSYGIFSRFS